MLMPEAQSIACPQCAATIRMTAQSAVRAADYGTVVNCRACNSVWLYRSGPPPMFGPISTPRRRRVIAEPDDSDDDA